MKSIKNYFLILLALCLFIGCSRKVTPVSQTYNEDLSGYRIKYKNEMPDNKITTSEKQTITPKVDPTNHVNDKVEVLMDSIANRNISTKYVQGYTIQVYQGGDREEATSIRNRLIKIAPDTRPQLSYDQPFYKVKVGEFINRIEAQKLYVNIKTEFPNALVLPEKISNP